MGIAHEGWWTRLGLVPRTASGTKAMDQKLQVAVLTPLECYPPVAFQDPVTGHTISIDELEAMIKTRKATLEAARRGESAPE